MKRSEFIKKMKKLGFRVKREDGEIYLVKDWGKEKEETKSRKYYCFVPVG